MSMGFCFYNNAGIAARAAQAAGARRVLILDWDVHHGNGAPATRLPCHVSCSPVIMPADSLCTARPAWHPRQCFVRGNP